MGQLERSKIVVLLAEVEGIELLVTGQCICACHRGANASIPQRTAFSKLHVSAKQHSCCLVCG